MNLPASIRRQSSYSGTVASGTPKSPARRRKGGKDNVPAASKPVLLLGR